MDICTSRATFDISGEGYADIRFSFDDDSADPDPGLDIRVEVVDPVKDIKYTLDSIGTGHPEPSRIMIPAGQEDQITAERVFTNDEDTRDFLTYKSNKPSLVSVDSNGHFTANEPQTASGEDTAIITIGTATNNTSRRITVIVREADADIAPMYVDVTGKKGLDGQGLAYVDMPETFKAVCLPSYSTQRVTWSVIKTTDADINENTGALTGKTPNATVTVTATAAIGETPSATGAKGNMKVVLRRKAETLEFKEKPPIIKKGDTKSVGLSSNQSAVSGIIRTPEDSWQDVKFRSSDTSVLTIGSGVDDCSGGEVTLTGTSSTLWYKGTGDGIATIYAETETGARAELEVAVADMDIINPVIELLEALPSYANTELSDETDVTGARAAYDALKEYQQTFTSAVYPKLTEAERKIADLKAQALAVKLEIEALPEYDQIQLKDEQAIIDAEDHFDELSDDQKKLIPENVQTKLKDVRESFDLAKVYDENWSDVPEDLVTAADIPDRKLREVLQILVNCKFTSRKDFYTLYADQIDEGTDITTLAVAEQYKKPVSKGLLAAFYGRIDLSPYTGITMLEGLNLTSRSLEGVEPDRKTTVIILPAVVDSEPLTEIEAGTFNRMTGLRSVVMPATVTSIGNSAFDNCSSLVSLTAAGSGHDEGDRIIDLSNVKTIGNAAFASCEALDNVSLYTAEGASDAGVTIDTRAFAGCSSLTEIEVPKGELGTNVFASCRSLRMVSFDDSYTALPDNTLTGVNPVEGVEITFSVNMEEIGAFALSSSVIKSTNIAECSKLRVIEANAFQNARFLSTWDLSGNNSLKEIGQEAFYEAKFTNGAVRIPESLDTMGLSAFFATTGLTSINIPKNLPAIPAGAFMYSYDLSEVIVPEHAKFASVGAHAFDLCGNLKDIDFLANSDELTKIGDYAFARCVPKAAEYNNKTYTGGLRTIVIPDTVTELGKSAFENDFLVTSADLEGNAITAIPDGLLKCEYSNSIGFDSIALVDEETGRTATYDFKGNDASLQAIKNAFSGYSKKMSDVSAVTVKLASQAAEIGAEAFYGKNDITVTYDGDEEPKEASLHFMSVRSIGDSAFRYCVNLENIKLPDTLETLGSYTFADDPALRIATLPSSLTDIPDHCFYKCSNLGNRSTVNINNVVSIGVGAFEECTKLANLSFGTKLESIGESAFRKSGLRSAESLNQTKITSLEKNVFEGCSALAAVICPDTLEAIKDYAFRDCTSLASVSFPVSASLSASMLTGDAQDIALMPTLGIYSNTVFRVPMGVKENLPAKVFARAKSNSEKYSQRDASGNQEELATADPKYFELSHKGDSFEITGGSYEITGDGNSSGTAVLISADIPFSGRGATSTPDGSITIGIEYPVDIIGVHADQEKMEFVPKKFKINSGEANLDVDDRNGTPVIYISRNRIGNNSLTLEATAVSTDAEYPGQITDDAVWTITDGKALTFREDSIVKNRGADECTSRAVFDITGEGYADVVFSFDDSSAEPDPSIMIRVEIVDPISSIKFKIDSIGDSHADLPSGQRLMMPAGQQDHITSEPVYTNSDTRDFLTYKSSNEALVSVDQDGNITAHSPHTASGQDNATITIKAASNYTSKTINVTVREADAEIAPVFVDVTGKTGTDGKGLAYVGTAERYTATCLPTYSTQKVRWTVANSLYASVESADDVSGDLTGITPNQEVRLTATAAVGFSATAAGEKGSMQVVLRRAAEELSYREEAKFIKKGDAPASIRLSSDQSAVKGIVRIPEDSWQDVTFRTSDPSVLTIGRSQSECSDTEVTLTGQSSTLWYKGVGDGRAKIYAETETGAKAELDVAVADMDIVHAVEDVLNALPAAALIRIDDEDDVSAARTAYDGLEDYQQIFVAASALKKLTDAEEKIQQLKDAADEVTAMIDALPYYEYVKTTDEDDIVDADEKYQKLRDDQQNYIPESMRNKLAKDKESLALAKIYEEGKDDVKLNEDNIPDDKLREIIQILVNCRFETRREFYDKYADKIGPDTDITQLDEAQRFNKPVSRKLAASFYGTIDLAPYSDITSLTGLNIVRKATAVVLPDKVGGSDLKVIPTQTFSDMTGLESVVIPATVTEIGDNAFEKCEKLESLTQKGSGNAAGAALIDLSRVTKIGSGAFASCYSIDNVQLISTGSGKDIEIGDGAFASCTKLSEINVPKGTIGNGVFSDCQSLSRVRFDDSYTKLPDNTLTGIGQNGGAEVHFPESMTEIGFYACSGSVITSSNLADCSELTKIGKYAFQNAYIGWQCLLGQNTKLATIEHSAFYGATFAHGRVTLPNGLNRMGISVFFATYGMTSVNIPDSLTSIPAGSFMRSHDLETVTATDNAAFTSVGAHAFDMCGSLSDMDFLAKGGKLTSIGEYAFARCIPEAAEYNAAVSSSTEPTGGLREIVIPATVTEIGVSAFENDFLVTRADFGANVTSIPGRALYCEDNKNVSFTNVTLTDTLSDESMLYELASNDQGTGYPQLRQRYSNYNMKLREICSIERVTLSPETVSIGDYAFFVKSGLSLTFEGDVEPAENALHFNKVKTIGSYAFANCSRQNGTGTDLVIRGIRRVELPDTLESLGTYAFANDYSLRSVVLPSKDSAFSEIPAYCFFSCGYDNKVGDVHEYSGLSLVTNLRNAKTIGEHAFDKCVNLTSVSIDGAETVGDCAFADCYKLEEISLGAGLSTLGKYSFRGTAITSIPTLTDTCLTKIDTGTFENCAELKTVNCPDSLTSIEGGAFKNCTSLTGINFPVYATLASTMLDGDKQTDLVLTPTLGRYKNTVFKIPTGKTVELPANAFAGCTKETISQRNTDGTDSELSQADPKYFTVVHKNNSYEITGGRTEVKGIDGAPGTAVMISATVNFNNSGARTMNISYPADVTRTHADADSIKFIQSAFRLNGSETGILVTREGRNPVLYVDATKIGRTLTLSAEAIAQAEPGNESPGLITDDAVWSVSSGDSVSFINDSVTTTTSKTVCTTKADFKIEKTGTSTVMLAFDDDTDTPPSKMIDIEVIDAISSLIFRIDSLGDKYDNPASITMPTGTEDRVTVIATYAGEDRSDSYYFTSNNTDVVTVDEEGKLVAVGAGQAEVRVKTVSNSIANSKKFTVTVVDPGSDAEPVYIQPAYVEISGDDVTNNEVVVYEGESIALSANCLPAYAGQGVTWSVENNDTSVRLDTNGNETTVTGVTPNKSVWVRATSEKGGKYARVKVNVKQITGSIVFRTDKLAVNASKAYDSFRMMATDDPLSVTSGIARVPATSDEPVTFTSSDTSVLQLSANTTDFSIDPVTITGKTGTIYYKGLKQGDAVITARTLHGESTDLAVHVTEPVTSMICTNPAVTMLTGEQIQMQIDKTPAYSDDVITYKSNREQVATVDAEGRIVAIGTGTAKITAASSLNSQVTATCTVNVQIRADSIEFRDNGLMIKAGENKNMRLSSTNDVSTVTTGIVRTPETSDQTVTFTSSDPDVLVLGISASTFTGEPVALTSKNATLWYKGLKEGTATITAETVSGARSTIEVRVVENPITRIEFAQTEITMLKGAATTNRITYTPAGTSDTISYESSDPGVVTVDAAGRIKAVAPGSATITARSAVDKVRASYRVRVLDVDNVFTSGKNQYIVRSDGTVWLSSMPYDVKSFTVPATVKLSGISYKVTGIAKNAGAGRTKLKTLVISNNVKTIGAGAFSNCTALTKVTIGTGVKTINGKAFSNCPKLKTVTIKSKVLTKVAKGAFKTIKKGATIKTPSGKKSKYRSMLKKSGLPKKAKVK